MKLLSIVIPKKAILFVVFLSFPLTANAYTCSNIDVSLGQCGASMSIINNKGDEIPGTRQSCEPWQTVQPLYCGTADNEYWEYFTCLCDPSCTGASATSGSFFKNYYYDDPAHKTDGAKPIDPASDGTYQNITLPVVLAWDRTDSGSGDTNTGWVYSYSSQYGCGYSKKKASDFNCVTSKDITVNNLKDMPDAGGRTFGGDNYIFEIKNAKDLNLSAELVKKHVNSKGEYTRCFENKKNEFNSVDDGGQCFLNSSSAYQWRVLPTCQKCDDSKPVEDSPGTPDDWWKFTTATSPEPLGVTDKSRLVPEPDPDWNGPDYVKNVDFCTAGLKWCAAKIEPSKTAFNLGIGQSLAYQMAVTYNEQVTLGGIASAIQSGDWWGAITKAASFLNLPGTGQGKQSQCHYLLVKQPTPDSPKVCTAEIVSPHGTLQKIPATEFSNLTDQNFDRGFFTKNLRYDWSLKRCFDNPNAANETCQQNTVKNTPLKDQNYGQTWSFETAKDATLPAPELASPPDDQKAGDPDSATPVGIPPTISWKPRCGANSFEYELDEGNQQLVKKETVASQVTFVDNAPTSGTASQNENVQALIKLDTAYKWKVRACWPSVAVAGDNSQLCDDKSWTDWFSFRTTGRAPQGLKIDDNKPAYIPTTFSWDPVPGAKSYILDITPAQGTHVTKLVSAPDPGKPVTIQVSYPDLKPKLTYTWMVKTCADAAGTANLCGAWSVKYSFGTSTLPAPSGYSSPRYLSSLDSYPAHLSWNAVKDAMAYRVTMDYINQDSNSECPQSGQLFDSVSPSNSYDPPGLAVACLGTYTWSVTSCLSGECNPDETGAAATWKFFIANGGGKSSGFMVCGLRDDDPNTSWDERNPCQFGDLFKILEKLIDFALFKLAFWLLPILAAITGGLFYTQFGGEDVLRKAKTMWKYIGIGYALLFFAWLLTTWTLQAFGYHGLWWKIL